MTDETKKKIKSLDSLIEQKQHYYYWYYY